MEESRTAYLIERLLSGSATVEEQEELAQWVVSQQQDGIMRDALEHAWQQYQPDKEIAALARPALDRIEAGLFHEGGTPARIIPMAHAKRLWWRVAAAVAVIVASVAIYTGWQWKAASQKITALEVAPGASTAMLTLGNGQVITLDSAHNGQLADEGNATIRKPANGQLVYQQAGSATGKTVYNSLATPRGGQYRLTLPDGTKVWLNAASSITYPTAFTGKERNVSVTGEAYFEVAANEAMPFRVSVGDKTRIDVLGTHFNVNAYTDEPSINTTLLEGAVKINAGEQKRVLLPGQQAQVARSTGQLQRIAQVNVNETVAWKNGTFAFTNASVPEVLRQLARWYNLEVVFQGAVPDITFTGEIDQDLTLSQVLQGLSKVHIHYRLEAGNKLVILP